MNLFRSVSVRLGEHKISTEVDCANPTDKSTCIKDDPPIQDIAVDKFIIHEEYTENKINDIALVRLKTEADLNNKKSVGTICLPTNFNQTIEAVLTNEPDFLLTVAGWGHSEENPANTSDVLRYANLPYVPNKECKQRSELLMVINAFWITWKEFYLNFFQCAGGHNKTDVCRGDSGGPLTCVAENDSGVLKIFQQGIV